MLDSADTKQSFFDEEPSDLIREHRCYYLMVNAISRRVRQLQLGERALALPPSGTRDPFYVAQEEFLQDKLDITPRRGPLFGGYYPEEESPDLTALLGMEDDTASFEDADDEE